MIGGVAITTVVAPIAPHGRGAIGGISVMIGNSPITVNDQLHGDRHLTVTVIVTGIVTERTAWVSGFLAGVTVMAIVTVVSGRFLGA